MKIFTKITIYFFALIAFTLSSCTVKPEPAKPLTSFTATVTDDNEKYTVVHNGNSLTGITYHTPEALNGLTYNYKNGVLSVDFLSLSYKPSNNSLPSDNNATKLHNILTAISSDSCYLLSTSDNTATYSLPTAEVICDYKTGRIKEIKSKENHQRFLFMYND